MKAFRKIVSGSVAGAVMMTLFSYALSAGERRKDISLYNIMEGKVSDLPGWLLHLGAGGLFTSLYHIIWKNTELKPKLAVGTMFGAANGVLSMAMWRWLSGKGGSSDEYRDLLLTHLVFGLFTVAGYNLGGSTTSSNNIH